MESGLGTYTNLKVADEGDRAPPDGFYVYAPEVLPKAIPLESKPKDDHAAAMMQRIRKRQTESEDNAIKPEVKRYRLSSKRSAGRVLTRGCDR